VVNHPLNRRHKLSALRRFVQWQVGSRLLPGKVALPFVDGLRLLVAPSMTGATGNIYCGLLEFEEMAFVLHALREGDRFADVGANVGAYSLLAAAARAEVIAFEPVPATFAHLSENVRLNHLEDRVRLFQVGVGRSPGRVRFTADRDAMNRVVAPPGMNGTPDHSAAPTGPAPPGTVEVPVEPLDGYTADSPPAVIKIDVEGFETEVVAGAAATLRSPSLLAVIMELNGAGAVYGFDERALHESMLAAGFTDCTYQPLERRLVPREGAKVLSGNTIYVRDPASCQERVRTARRFAVRGEMI